MAQVADQTITASPAPAPAPATAPNKGGLVTVARARLPYHPSLKTEFGVDPQAWKALCEAVFPLAQEPGSVVMALSYCRARKLDPFKRVVHIVPVWSKDAGKMVDTVWPGIAELRTTAFRTGLYAGRDRTEFGPDIVETIGTEEVTYPEWAQVTVYRLIGDERAPFPGPTVYWRETYAQAKRNDVTPNSMWLKRPRGQLEKCSEAAALRAAFPEELGGEYTSDEMHGQVIDGAYDARTETWSADAMAERPRRDDGPRLALMTVDEETGEIAAGEPMTAAQWCTAFREAWAGLTLDGRDGLVGANRGVAQDWSAGGDDAPMAVWNEYACALDLEKAAAAKKGELPAETGTGAAAVDTAAPSSEPDIVKMYIARNMDAEQAVVAVEAIFGVLRKAPTAAWLKRWRRVNEMGLADLPSRAQADVGKAIEKRMAELSGR